MTALTIGSLFAGYGGLDLATEAALDARTAWVSDIDPGACKVLAHRFPHAPNHGDITTIDWASVEPVDIITGGSPCQDLSMAGRRAGMTDGTRSNLWVQMREAIAHVQPRFVIWENVRGALSAHASSDLEPCAGCVGDGSGEPALRALGRILGDLADLGYDAEWRGLRASDVGACHQRFRVFVLAWRRDAAAHDASGIRGREAVKHDGSGAQAAYRAGVPHQPDRDALRAGPDGGLVTLPTPTTRDYKDHEVGPAAHRPGDVDSLARALGSLLPTPRSSDTNGAGEHGAGGPDLRTVVTMLPTPRATDGTKGGPNQRGSSGDLMLPSAVAQLLPTPAAGVFNDGEDVATWQARRERVKAELGNGNGFGMPLGIAVAHPDFGQYAAAVARQEVAFGHRAPSPTEPGKNRPRLAARFCEWMMGLPAGWITDVPVVTRNEALRMAGNGVVPQQAAAALRDMLPHAIAALDRKTSHMKEPLL